MPGIKKKIISLLDSIALVGKWTLLARQSISSFFKSLISFRFPWKQTSEQMAEIGFNSLPIVLFASLFTGMVGVVQVGYQFEKFGATHLIGGIIALTLAREVGPVMTGIILAGRIGSAYAAELGSMKVTEQIDALRSLATDPVEFLVMPRFLASIFMIVMLNFIFNFLGLMGGYVVAELMLNLSFETFFDSVIRNLSIFDILGGAAKSVFFGGIVSLVACQEGFQTQGGAMGVGKATTRAVVLGILGILFLNLIFTIGLVNFQKSPFYQEFNLGF